MDKNGFLSILTNYKTELEDILSRFQYHHINQNDDPVYRQKVQEIIDLLTDNLVENPYSSRIASFFNEGISNFTGLPSYKSVENIIGVIGAIITRVSRKPGLLNKSNHTNQTMNDDIRWKILQYLNQFRDRAGATRFAKISTISNELSIEENEAPRHCNDLADRELIEVKNPLSPNRAKARITTEGIVKINPEDPFISQHHGIQAEVRPDQSSFGFNIGKLEVHGENIAIGPGAMANYNGNKTEANKLLATLREVLQEDRQELVDSLTNALADKDQTQASGVWDKIKDGVDVGSKAYQILKALGGLLGFLL